MAFGKLAVVFEDFSGFFFGCSVTSRQFIDSILGEKEKIVLSALDARSWTKHDLLSPYF